MIAPARTSTRLAIVDYAVDPKAGAIVRVRSRRVRCDTCRGKGSVSERPRSRKRLPCNACAGVGQIDQIDSRLAKLQPLYAIECERCGHRIVYDSRLSAEAAFGALLELDETLVDKLFHPATPLP